MPNMCGVESMQLASLVCMVMNLLAERYRLLDQKSTVCRLSLHALTNVRDNSQQTRGHWNVLSPARAQQLEKEIRL